MAVVNVQHVVTSNVADAAPSGPSVRAIVLESPDLSEAGTRCDRHTVRDAVAHESSAEERSRSVELQIGQLLDYRQRLDNGDGLRELLETLLELLLDLLLELVLNFWLDLGNSLDLTWCVGGKLRQLRQHARGQRVLEDWVDRALVAHVANVTTSILIHSSDADVLDGCLELDERVSAIVVVTRQGLARSAEVGIVAHSALVANTHDVRLISLVLAQRAVAVDTSVASEHRLRLGDRVVDRGEAVTRVLEGCVSDTSAAVVPVGAVQALVANTVDGLVAAIADGVVTNVATGSQRSLIAHTEVDVLCGRLESVGRVVTVLVGTVAIAAQVEVLTGLASDELVFWKHIDAVVASASGFGQLLSQRLGLFCKGARDLFLDLLLSLSLAPDALGGAGDDLAVLNSTLDQPVTLARAKRTTGDASLAEVVVAAIADAAVIVRIVHGGVAAVAVDRPLTLSRSYRSDSGLTATESKVTRDLDVGRSTGEGTEEVGAVRGEGLRDRSLGLDKSLLRCASLTELEDSTADGATIQGSRVAGRSLVVGGANDDRLCGLLGGHIRSLLWRGWLLDLRLGEVGSDGSLEPQLGLGFGSTNEGLEDLWVVGLKDNVATG
jgi:hypothetical protein